MIEKNLTELICKELCVENIELTPSEKQIIKICSGLISSLNSDIQELEKRTYKLEIQIKNKDIIIRDMLENIKEEDGNRL